MRKVIVTILVLIFMHVSLLNAQNIGAQVTDAQVLLQKCIDKNRVYPKAKYEKSFFEDVNLHIIPTYKIEHDTLCVTDNILPYLIVLSKNGEYVGVISTDDKGNSYVDMEYNYKYDGAIKQMWPIWYMLNSKDNIKIFNLQGVDDQLVFILFHNEIRYLNINFEDLNIDEIDKSPIWDKFKSFPSNGVKSLFSSKNPKQNVKRNLRYPKDAIKYD
ncbi:MAG: hypothetical protein J6U21_02495 [Bacteroidales bacterium]|nr:hypothetical protein [Bacteroidales bacterium]